MCGVALGTLKSRVSRGRHTPNTTLKVATAERSVAIDSTHVDVPEQAPDQPAKVDPAPAVAVSVTVVLALNAGVVHVTCKRHQLTPWLF